MGQQSHLKKVHNPTKERASDDKMPIKPEHGLFDRSNRTIGNMCRHPLRLSVIFKRLSVISKRSSVFVCGCRCLLEISKYGCRWLSVVDGGCR